MINSYLNILKTQKVYKNKIPKKYFFQNVQILNQIGRAKNGELILILVVELEIVNNSK